jgi:hypothetical protein
MTLNISQGICCPIIDFAIAVSKVEGILHRFKVANHCDVVWDYIRRAEPVNSKLIKFEQFLRPTS